MTYEYLCAACGNDWEAEQPISEAPLKKCPKCKKNTAKRQVSGGAGFILKGGGWYSDGYGSAKPKQTEAAASAPKDKSDAGGGESKASSGADSKAEGKSDSKAEGKSDSKPASKSDSKSDEKPKAPTRAA